MKKFLTLLAAAMASVAVLTGCSSGFESADNAPSRNVHTVELPDGRSVLCIFEKNGYGGGGLSCDWDNAK